MVNSFLSSDISNKLAQEASQKMDKKETGLSEALLAGAVLAIAVGISQYLISSGLAKQEAAVGGSLTGGGTKGGIPIIIWLILIAIVLWIIYAYFRKIWPFKRSKLWGAKFTLYDPKDPNSPIMVDGDTCIEYDNNAENEGKAVYKTKIECDKALSDPKNNTFRKFFGCKYDTTTGTFNGCKQYPTLWSTYIDNDNNEKGVEAFYRTKGECETDNNCSTFYTCNIDPNDGLAINNECIAKSNEDRSSYTYTYNTKEDCDSAQTCVNTWYCANKGAKNDADKCDESLAKPCEDTSKCSSDNINYVDKQKCIDNCTR